MLPLKLIIHEDHEEIYIMLTVKAIFFYNYFALQYQFSTVGPVSNENVYFIVSGCTKFTSKFEG